MIELCKTLLRNPNAYIVDTETTGTDSTAEVIQIGVVDMEGNTILDTLVRPRSARIHPGAYQVHRIAQGELLGAPTLPSLDLKALFTGKLLLAYNAVFDIRLLRQSASAWGEGALADFFNTTCARGLYEQPDRGKSAWIDLMQPYRKHWGDSAKLVEACQQQGVETHGGHNAIDDCLLILRLIRQIATQPAKVKAGRQLSLIF